jgi:hydrogenase-4 component E
MNIENIFLLTACLIILLDVFIQWQVYIKKNIITFSINSLILAIFLFILGYKNSEQSFYLISILTIIVRVIFIPRFMVIRLTKDHWRERETYPIMGTASAIICSILIVILCYIVYTFTLFDFLKIRSGALPIAIIFQGLF